MDSRTGEILHLSPEMIKAMGESGELKHMIPLTNEKAAELESMTPFKRKGHMRNQPCPCGSGTKFKRCCWENYK